MSYTVPGTGRRQLLKSGLALGVASLFGAAATACGKKGGGGSDYPSQTLQLMAPAKPGGGWDLTARTLQKALTDAGLSKSPIEVYNVEGAAGTLGLAQLVTKNDGDPYQLMITGLVMIGGVVANKSPVNLTQVTPVATLTAEQEVIVVPANSPHKDLKALMEAAKANPQSVNWGGGSAGGTDQILVGLLAKAAGIDPKSMKYLPYSGGGESKAALLSGDLTAGVSGVSEYVDLVKDGKVRALAVSGATGVDAGAGSPAPTIKQSGYDVELSNWRGIVAPPGIDEDERKDVIGLIDKVHASSQWQQALKEQGWDDFYKSGDEAKSFFDTETTRITGVLTEIGLAG